jgi:hypothetical protein
LKAPDQMDSQHQFLSIETDSFIKPEKSATHILFVA